MSSGAKWKSTPDFTIPPEVKQTCVREENWPEDFNIATDSVRAYAIPHANGTITEHFFVHRLSGDWVEYYPEPKHK